MNFKKAIISYLPHKRTENARNKKIIFFAIMKPLRGELKTPNKTAKQNAKRGLYHGKHKQSECEI
ncbi:type I restriction endonuclease [Helicobacter pylori]|uniref:type I restriction endonuclease n=1 Tax=Helicobacter pylori TaxID=210 RepID=UPI000FDF4428|nr:type I restriction endonuclease [Helicobacter pylori]RVZ91547.1 type I restriction endonuclease [Helicobacter pylori]